MSGNRQVLIVDEQQRSRQSLRALLATWPPARQIQEAVSGQQALQYFEQSRPDIVLIDLHAPEGDGLSLVSRIKINWPETKVIVLSLYCDYATDAMEAGADAYIVKGEPPNRLLEILEAVVAEG